MKKALLTAVFALLTIINVHGKQVDYEYRGHFYQNVYYEDFLATMDEIIGNEIEEDGNAN